MGTLTLKQMRDLIVIDCGIEANPKFPPARVNKEINLAQRYVQSRLNSLGMKRWETLSSPLLNSETFVGQPVRTIPIDMVMPDLLETPKSIKFIECRNINRTINGLAFEVSDTQFLEQITNTYYCPTIEKPVFMRLANKLWLAPSAIATCTVHYYRSIPNLVSDTDVSQMPDEFEDYVLQRAELQIKSKVGLVKDEMNEAMLLDKALNDAYQKYAGAQLEKAMNDSSKNKLQ